uniref:putative F-box protein At3g16210 n=1 Tax=Fragaria vesca subsp. vesca TaxID=101020 RepID=UPI0005CAADB6|nr:PREDICTED: putative F-box protein At3g16210 [Fragaria vesca subsp. vesca]
MEKADDDSNQLPSEIIHFEILPRLPRASLMQFRCVSKTWKALLSANPGFWRIHRNLHPQHTGHLLIKACSGSGATRKRYLVLVKASQEGNTPSHVTDLVKLPCPFKTMQYTNGLVLGHSGLDNDPIYVLNPFTRESVIVPYPTFQYEELHFGFSPSTDEYKVVATHDIGGVVGFKIFTLGQASWRNMVVDWHHLSFVHPPPSNFRKSVCVNGVLYWLLSLPSHKAILALDIGDERFGIIPVPSRCYFEGYIKLMEVDGCLYIVIGDYNKMAKEEVMLLILKDYKHQVWVTEIINPSLLWGYRVTPLPRCTTRTGDEFVFDVSKNNYLKFYDRKSKKSRRSKIIFPIMLRDLGLMLSYSAVSYDDCVAPLK